MNEKTRILETRVITPRYSRLRREDMPVHDVVVLISSASFAFGMGFILGMRQLPLWAWICLVSGTLTLSSNILNTYIYIQLASLTKTEEIIEYIENEPEEPPLVVNVRGRKTLVSKRADIKFLNGYILTGDSIDKLHQFIYMPDGSVTDTGFSRDRLLTALYGSNSRDSQKDSEYQSIRDGLESLGHIAKGGGNRYQWTESGLMWLWSDSFPHPTNISA